MFAVGQKVYHRARPVSGKVVECDRDTVFLMQENGSEVEFPSRDLTTTPPPNRQAAAAVAVAPAMARHLTIRDITPEHVRVLSIIPQRTMQTIAALYERQPKAGRFSGLNVAEKLNYITSVSAIPYLTMKQYSDRPGELGLMMARGLSISTGTAR